MKIPVNIGLTVLTGIVITIMVTAPSINAASPASPNLALTAKPADKVNVDCEDLAIALITWDQLLARSDADDRTEIEDTLGEGGIANGLFQDWIDQYLNDLQDDVNDKCTHLDSDIEDYLDSNEFEVP